jgi:cytochrome c oxidase cbb3-type subunit 3
MFLLYLSKAGRSMLHPSSIFSGLGLKAKCLLTGAAMLGLTACDDTQSTRSNATTATEPSAVQVIDLEPGTRVEKAKVKNPYAGDLEAINEGKRLYSWFNCVGCHANGGGGMGPPFIDDKWIYGSDNANVFASILEGRPNGMPSFGDKIPEQDIWKLVAYVRSLGGLEKSLLTGASNMPLQDKASANQKKGEAH